MCSERLGGGTTSMQIRNIRSAPVHPDSARSPPPVLPCAHISAGHAWHRSLPSRQMHGRAVRSDRSDPIRSVGPSVRPTVTGWVGVCDRTCCHAAMANGCAAQCDRLRVVCVFVCVCMDRFSCGVCAYGCAVEGEGDHAGSVASQTRATTKETSIKPRAKRHACMHADRQGSDADGSRQGRKREASLLCVQELLSIAKAGHCEDRKI